MKRSQVLLLAVALVAGGLAGFLVLRGGSRPAPVVKEVAQTTQQSRTKVQVLVAAQDIGVGQRLSADAVAWQDWPDSALRPEYITNDTAPDAPKDMKGSVARFEIFNGEPIRQAKLVHTDQGYLSAVLLPGMRGVSVTVTPESGSGGFIMPNDHVDVVSTHSSSGGEISETVLTNVKVLAVGKRLGEVGSKANPDTADGESKTFDRSTIATLELDPAQAETLLAAAGSGNLSLVLRSVTDFAASAGDETQSRNQVKVIRYGKQERVMAAGSGGDVSVNPAAYAPSPPAETSAPATPDVELQ